MTERAEQTAAALHEFADELEREATKYDKPAYGKEVSTVANTFRHAASLARQRARRVAGVALAAINRKGER